MLPDVQIKNTVLQNQEEIVVVPSDGQFCNALMLQPGGKFRIRMALKWDIHFRL
jgi:hypothetical protein